MRATPLTVLHWAPQTGTETGTGKAIDGWTRVAAAAGADVRVISGNHAPRTGGAGEVSYFGGRVGRWKLLAAFLRQLRDVGMVHLHGAFDPTLSLVLLVTVIEKFRRVLCGRRLVMVLTPHGALSDYVFRKGRVRKWAYWNLLDRWLMGWVDGFICNTPVETGQLKRRLPRALCFTVPLVVGVVPTPDVGVLPDTVRSEDFRLHEGSRTECPDHGGAGILPANTPKSNNNIGSSRTTLGGQTGILNPEEIPVLCTIGRYDLLIKGLDILIRAVVRLNHEGEPVRLKCAGYDRQGGVSELRQFVDSVDAGLHVECAGPKHGAEKAALLAQATVFCMPSRYESFGYSLIEGLASGLPVLVGSGACITSYMNDEQKGRLVVEPTVDAWVSAVRRVLADRKGNRQCAAKAYQDLSRLSAPSAVGEALQRIYIELT